MTQGTPEFKAAFPFQKDVLTLPVTDLDTASAWYTTSFGMTEVERREDPRPTVILERDGARIGFSLTGEDPSQDGAAVLVSSIGAIREEFESRGVDTVNWRIDERDGERFQVFFVRAPDGLCYYFHEPL